MKVKDPQGATWRVTRRWVPWRRRLKGFMDDAPDLPMMGDDPISAILGLLLLVLLIPFLVVAFIAALELLLLLLVLPVALLLRVAFGRHWTIEVRRGFRPWWEAPAGSWRESRTAIRDVAEALRRGEWSATWSGPAPPDEPGRR